MTNETHETLNEIQLITFTLAKDIFAVDILQLKEICSLMPFTPVPNTPKYIQGVINLRGRIVPVVDLRKRFNLKDKKHTEETKIIVTKLEEQSAGFIVDTVLDVLELQKDAIETPSRTLTGFEGKYIKGMVNFDNNLIVLLDLYFVLTSDEKIDLSSIIKEPL